MALQSNLLSLIPALLTAADRSAQDIADAVVEEARQRVAVDTGALRTSIQIDGASGTGERTVDAGQGLGYAPFLEYGTSRQAAQPFMTPAAERVRGAMPQIVATNVQAAVSANSL